MLPVVTGVVRWGTVSMPCGCCVGVAQRPPTPMLGTQVTAMLWSHHSMPEDLESVVVDATPSVSL